MMAHLLSVLPMLAGQIVNDEYIIKNNPPLSFHIIFRVKKQNFDKFLAAILPELI
jgi:hypothetical protein